MIAQVACNFFSLVLVLDLFIGMSNSELQNTPTTKGENVKFPTVTIPQGALQGTFLLSRHNRSISAFKGIPYAQPPVGNLRFSSPVPANPWNDTLDATTAGNSCPQPGIVGKEDCLYLNVYTPQLPESEDTPLLPVMMHIHGGRFEVGDGSALFGPTYLLDADLVLVSINYRLGTLGFLSTGDAVAPGNWGLKDQVLALRWIQENIEYFGGDHDQVTIFGQSSGGSATQLLALSESTIGLFHKLISQSGAVHGFGAYRPRSSAVNLALQLGEIFSCPTHTSSLLVDCLRQLDASEIINARTHALMWYQYPLVTWSPTDEPDVEGAFLTDSPANLLAAGKIRDLPTMTGAVKDDGIIFVPGILPDSDMFEEFLENFDERLPTVLQYWDQVEDVPSFTAALKEFYFNNDLTTDRTQVWSHAADLVSDGLFIHSVYKTLQKQFAFAKSPSFLYSFEYRGDHSYGDKYNSGGVLNGTVIHSDDLLYLFPRLESTFGVRYEQISKTDQLMIDTMVQLWTSFAINGTPTTTAMISNTTWLPYSLEENYLRIGNGSDPAIEVQYNFLQDRMQLWNRQTIAGSGNTATISPSLKFIFMLVVAYQNIHTSISN